jgi:hypothetical protein
MLVIFAVRCRNARLAGSLWHPLPGGARQGNIIILLKASKDAVVEFAQVFILRDI